MNGATPSLKRLTQHFLGIEIQSGEHSSVIICFNLFWFTSCIYVGCVFKVQDAKAALRLYIMFRQRWESELTKRKSRRTLKREDVKNKRHARDMKAK